MFASLPLNVFLVWGIGLVDCPVFWVYAYLFMYIHDIFHPSIQNFGTYAIHIFSHQITLKGKGVVDQLTYYWGNG